MKVDAVASRRVTIVNSRGLHARAAVKFAKLANSFDAEVTVVKRETEVPGSSIMGLLMLAATPGCDLEIRARGAAAEAALEALAQLVANKFDEDG